MTDNTNALATLAALQQIAYNTNEIGKALRALERTLYTIAALLHDRG